MANMIDTLIQRFKKGIVAFSYIKKDGNERHAVGTLFGVGHTIKGTGTTKNCPWLLKYYDVECHGWRSFIIANLVSVGEVRPCTIDEHHSICLALVIKLKQRMQEENEVAFAYRKIDGSIRYAHGTLLPDSDNSDTHFRYFDTDKKEERQFRIDSFIGFGEAEEIDIECADFFHGDSNTTQTTSTESSPCDHPAGHREQTAGGFSDTRIASILREHGISEAETEEVLVVDLLPYLDKEQLKNLIIKATTRLAEL